MSYLKILLFTALFVYTVQGATKTEEKKLEDVLNTKKAADTAAVTTEKKDDKAKDAAVSDPSSYKKVCVQYGYGCQQQLKCNIGGYKGNCALVWKCNKNICVKYGHAGSHKSHSSHSKGGRPHHDEPADELSDEELNEEAKEEASEDEDEQFDEDENLDQIEEESDEDEDFDPSYRKCVKTGISCHRVRQCSYPKGGYTPYHPRCKLVKKCQQVCRKYVGYSRYQW